MKKLALLDSNNTTYQHLIANKFGYSSNWLKDYYQKLIEKSKKLNISFTDKNTTKKCLMCGQVFPIGVEGKDVKKADVIFTKTYNGAYSLANSTNANFICGPCVFSFKNYNKSKMQNIAVFKDRVEKISINASNNTMYEYFVSPPSEPFIMIINTRGTVLEFLTHLALPSVSKEIITLVYGEKVMNIERELLLECLDATDKLMNEYKINKNLLLNTKMNGSRYAYTSARRIRENQELQDALVKFWSKYDKETRVIAGKLLEKHIKTTKTNQKKGK
jgi:CRISPR type IV-associated protein Csf1